MSHIIDNCMKLMFPVPNSSSFANLWLWVLGVVVEGSVWSYKYFETILNVPLTKPTDQKFYITSDSQHLQKLFVGIYVPLNLKGWWFNVVADIFHLNICNFFISVAYCWSFVSVEQSKTVKTEYIVDMMSWPLFNRIF